MRGSIFGLLLGQKYNEVAALGMDLNRLGCFSQLPS